MNHRVLTVEEWTGLAEAHRNRVHELTAAHLERRAHGARHPVWDFMFNYYPVTPGKLAHWHPGAHVALRIPPRLDALPRFKDHYVAREGAWVLDPQRHWDDRGRSITYIRRLLDLTRRHAPQLNCFGLHEWAMVYRDTPRHPEPLRLGAEGTDAVVESQQLRCTHIDAFRFFTSAASSRNELHPTRETQPELEQPGCLHATMDLYKWATKLGPLIPGELWLRTFTLACDVRQLDMEASPYDLRGWGFTPVAIETPAGRAEYVRRQKGLMERGQLLRSELISHIDTAYPHLAESRH